MRDAIRQRIPRARDTLGAALIAGALATAAPAQGVYWTKADLLKSFFAECERVSYRTIDPSPSQAARLAKRLGEPARDAYTVFYGVGKGGIRGIALIDEEIGQHMPITFGVLVGTDGAAERIEVLVYREAYGDEVRGHRFTRQLEGKRSTDRLRVGDDIDAISGATISAHSLVRGVKRCLVLAELLVLEPGMVEVLRP